MYYYLSIGTNIEPEANAVRISTALARVFGKFSLYPFVYTTPVAMKSSKAFLNSLAIISSEHDTDAVKLQLNAIEIALGRDRQDPLRSEKDRSADIDILTSHPNYNESLFLNYDAPYIPLVLGISKDINTPNSDENPSLNRCADLSHFGLALNLTTPQRPATVYFNTRTRHVAVINDRHRGLHNGLESAFTL